MDRISQEENLGGILRLGVSETIVHTWLSAFIAGMKRKYPAIELEIIVDTTVNPRSELTERSVDFALLMGPVSDFQIENHDLMEVEIIWAASSSLKIDATQLLSLDELAHYPLITYAKNTRPYAELARQLRKITDFPARIFPSSSLAAIHKMAQDGLAENRLKVELSMETQIGMISVDMI